MKLRKVLAFVLVLALVLTSFAACSSGETTTSTTNESSASTQESTAGESSAEETGAAEDDFVRGSGAVVPEKKDLDPNNTLNIRIGMEPTSMNTLQATYADEFTMLNNIYEPLLRINEEDKTEGAAAESWDISEDGLVYTFHLRKDSKWTNGDTVTAEDFAFAWERLLAPETAAEYAYFLFFVKGAQDYNAGKCEWEDVGVKVLDDFTLEVTLHTPVPYAEELFRHGCLMPVNKSFYEAVGADKYGTEPEYYCSNGPFALVEWSHGEKLVCQKNEGYHDADRVSVDGVVYKIITDANAVISSFIAGDIDYSSTLSTGEAIDMVQNAGFDTTQYLASTVYYLNVNTENEYLSNVNLRKAIGLAFDKEVAINSALNNGSIPMKTFVASTTLMAGSGANLQDAVIEANGGEPLYPVNGDKEAAKEYFAKALEELGVTVEDLNGKIGIDVSNAPDRIALCSVIQEELRQTLGLEITVNTKESAQVAEDRKNGNYTLSFGGWGPDYNDPVSDLDLWVTGGGNNDTRWSNEEYDALIADSRIATDPQKRLEDFVRCEQILAEEYPIMPIFNNMATMAISPRVKSGFIVTTNQTTYRFAVLN